VELRPVLNNAEAFFLLKSGIIENIWYVWMKNNKQNIIIQQK
jgi:hypothetical protein